MDDSEQVDFILEHTPESERDELAEDFRAGHMTVDELIFGEDDDAAMRRGGAAPSTAAGCALLVLTLLIGVAATRTLIAWRRNVAGLTRRLDLVHADLATRSRKRRSTA